MSMSLLASVRRPLLLTGALIALLVFGEPDSPPAVSAGTTDPEVFMWGDFDCDREITLRDRVATLREVVGLASLSQTEPCPDLGSNAEMTSPHMRQIIWGDWTCSETMDVVDALAIERFVLQLSPAVQQGPCPNIPDEVELTYNAETANDILVPQGQSLIHVDVTMHLNSPWAVGGFDIVIDFDRSGAEMSQCDVLPSFAVMCNENYGDGSVRSAGSRALAFDEPLPLSFDTTRDSPLTSDVLSLVDPEGHPISGEVEFVPPRIRPFPRGDADCESGVTESDLIAVLERAAGLVDDRSCSAQSPSTKSIDVIPPSDDTDCDGEPTARDALRLLLYFSSVPVPEIPGCEPIGT